MKNNIFFMKWGIVLCAIGMFFMTSCYEDKGNYEYSDIKEVKFKDLESVYTVKLGGNVTIKPTMDPAPEDETGFTYEWVYLNPPLIDGYKNIRTIWDQKWIEDEYFPQLQIGQNKMIYIVTDTKRGVKYTSDYFVIDVANDFKQGFLVLVNEKVDGKNEAALRFINYTPTPTFDKEKGEVDIKSVNLDQMPPLGEAKGIAAYVDNYSPAPDGTAVNAAGVKTTVQYAVTLVTETGIYKLNPLDLTYNDLYHGRYFIQGDYSNAKFTDIVTPVDGTRTAGQSAYLRDDANNIYYYRYAAGGSALYLPWTANVPLNRYAIKDGSGNITGFSPFEASKAFVGWNTSQFALLYDKTNRCFAFKPTNYTIAGTTTSTSYNHCEPLTGTGHKFPVNNCGPTFDPLWITMRQHSYQNAPSFLGFTNLTAYVVAKNTNGVNGAIDLLMFYSSSTSTATSAAEGAANAQYMIDLSGLTDIGNAKLFAIHDMISMINGGSAASGAVWANLFFYATDKKIYYRNIVAGHGGVTPVYTPDGSETIVNMKFVTFPSVPTTLSNPFTNNMMVVTTKTGQRSDGTQGAITVVRIFEVGATYGELTLRKLENNKGEMIPCEWAIDGEYVGIDWKAKSV